MYFIKKYIQNSVFYQKKYIQNNLKNIISLDKYEKI